ncbi:MAG: RNA 2',3'-cyclic phosphodiesterase [Firmicutes bacterium]|nr:RNA 2',3'-cyclic phosphodiesterase [Bacillota bacterium]
MRVFVAIELTDKIKDKLSDLQSEIKEICPIGNYSSWDNFHLTLRFIGEIDESKIEGVKVCLENVGRGTRKFSIILMNLGIFKKRNRFVVWTGVMDNTSLLRLYNKIELCLVDSGFIREDRIFRPHITVGRNVLIGDVVDLSVHSYIIEGISMEIRSICLMESKRVEGVLRYIPLYRTYFNNI